MSVFTEEYIRMLESLSVEELERLVEGMLVSMAITMVVSTIICFVVAKFAKISLGYTFLGLLGMTGLYMMACRVIAAKNGASPHFVWMGLLGLFGVILAMGIIFCQKAQNMSNQSTTTNTYENYYRQEEQEQGYHLNGEYHSHDRGSICLNCGAAVAAGEKNCPRCGSRV